MAPQYHVACAATLPTMGFSRPASFPVGKVTLMRLDPMSFTEFLRAEGDADANPHGHPNSDPLPADPLDGLRTLHTLHTLEPIPEALFDELFEKLACYLTTGGMPEAVFASVLLRTERARENATKHASESASESASELEHDADPVRSVIAESAKAYERDFVAHGKGREFSRIAKVWNSLPTQLARKNEAFEYGLVREGARARTYEAAVRWLEEARLVHRIPRSTGLGLPVAANDDRSEFRLYPADVGVLRGLAHCLDLLRPSAAGAKGGVNEGADEGAADADGNRPLAELNGALAEAFVLQSLAAQFEVTPRYWAQDASSGSTIFLIQRENDIVPVEVRTEGKELEEDKEGREDGSGGGLDALEPLDELKTLFPGRIKLCVRFSTGNLTLEGDVLTVPFFLADRTDRLIGLALAEIKSRRQEA